MAVINDRLVRSFESGNLILMDEGGEKFVGKKKKKRKKETTTAFAELLWTVIEK